MEILCILAYRVLMNKTTKLQPFDTQESKNMNGYYWFFAAHNRVICKALLQKNEERRAS